MNMELLAWLVPAIILTVGLVYIVKKSGKK
ncbi:hypothetical protein RHSA111115_14000 [Rheinheimera salexigens]